MPAAARKCCRKAMCPNIHRNRNGYCDAHQSMASGWSGADRGTAEQRGYGSAWRALSRAILMRDGYRCHCLECRRLGRVLVATEVDHRVPKFEGGTDEPSNLYAINRECHKRKTATESARARGKSRH